MIAQAAIALIISLAAGAALAQSHQPYAGLQARPIKALSAEQIADLQAGRGMSLALAAELNGYPGPLHVIELADQLSLNPAQRTRMQQLFDQMKKETIAIGQRLIAQEEALDRQFADRKITQTALVTTTAAAAHLRYHLLAAEILMPAQMQRYAQLRGYHGDTKSPPQHPRSHR
jgi:hypothetical protein